MTTNIIRLGLTVTAMAALAACAAETAEPKGDAAGEPALGVSELGGADGHSLHQGELVYGELYEGELSPRSPYHWWTFEAEAGQAVFFDAASRAGDDLFFLLYQRTARGYEVVDYNDDCYSGTLDACLEPTFAETGEYAALVTTYRYAYWGRPQAASYHLTSTCRNCEPAAECPAED